MEAKNALYGRAVNAFEVYYGKLLRCLKWFLIFRDVSCPFLLWRGEIENKISWIKRDVVLNAKDKGHLWTGSLSVVNYSLMYKWNW